MRNCGGTESLTPTLYHSGLGCDIAAVVRELTVRDGLTRIAVIGYSAGGNMTMNMLGEFTGRLPASLIACAVISPAMDPELTAYMLDEPHNFLYRRNFITSLLKLYQRKMSLYPHLYHARELRPYSSIVEFDDLISGPYNGFPGAKALYDAISSSRFAEKVAVPVLVIRSLDDPFINYRAATVAKLHSNPYIHYVETSHGGHCAFIGHANGYDGRWAERACVDFVKSVDEGSNHDC
jgi:predicted alpha/beta-fold hydrolase